MKSLYVRGFSCKIVFQSGGSPCLGERTHFLGKGEGVSGCPPVRVLLSSNRDLNHLHNQKDVVLDEKRCGGGFSEYLVLSYYLWKSIVFSAEYGISSYLNENKATFVQMGAIITRKTYSVLTSS